MQLKLLESMPPIPDPLHDETLLKLDKLSRRLEDAQSFQITRLRNHTGSIAVQQQYAAELREDTESYRRELEVVNGHGQICHPCTRVNRLLHR